MKLLLEEWQGEWLMMVVSLEKKKTSQRGVSLVFQKTCPSNEAEETQAPRSDAYL